MSRLPRKVLHVLNGAGGGAAMSTLGLMRALRARGVASCAVCDDAGSADEREALRAATGGEVEFLSLYWWNRKIRARAWKRPALEALQWARTGARLGSVVRIAAAVRRFGAELVHTNTLLTPDGGQAARVLGVPHVWHVRELIGPDQPFQLPMSERRLRAYLLGHATVLVANSEASAKGVRGLVPADRLTVIPNGIDLERFERIAPRPAGTLTIGMIANLTSRTKRHGLFAEIARAAPVGEYRLYGHAPPRGADAYADEVRAQCEQAGVKVMGFVPVEEAMGQLDVLVHTAENESFGRTVVEAMAAGLPVVVANGGGVAESVLDGETGYVAEPHVPGGFARHLCALAASPELRAKLGAAARTRARKHFSLDACANQLAMVYQAALSRPLVSGWTGVLSAW